MPGQLSHRYTSARAQDLRDGGDSDSYGRHLHRIVSRFWKCYVIRRGYGEGPHGFLIALCTAYHPILSYRKARLDPSGKLGRPSPSPLADTMGPTLSRGAEEDAEYNEAGEGGEHLAARRAADG